MKKNIQLSILSLFLVAISMTSCSKEFSNAVIHRDCTGTYLELNKKDHLICNPEMADSFENGKSIQVQYKTVSNCPKDSNTMICAMYHESFGFVKILKIK